MSETNGHGLSIEEFLAKHPVEKKARPVTLKDGSTVYFRRASFEEVRALEIGGQRAGSDEATRMELRHVARLWCLDEDGTPALTDLKKIDELARTNEPAVSELIIALNSIADEDEAKN